MKKIFLLLPILISFSLSHATETTDETHNNSTAGKPSAPTSEHPLLKEISPTCLRGFEQKEKVRSHLEQVLKEIDSTLGIKKLAELIKQDVDPSLIQSKENLLVVLEKVIPKAVKDKGQAQELLLLIQESKSITTSSPKCIELAESELKQRAEAAIIPTFEKINTTYIKDKDRFANQTERGTAIEALFKSEIFGPLENEIKAAKESKDPIAISLLDKKLSELAAQSFIRNSEDYRYLKVQSGKYFPAWFGENVDAIVESGASISPSPFTQMLTNELGLSIFVSK